MARDNRKSRSQIKQRLAALRPTDRAVLLYLDKLRKDRKSDTCTVSIPAIAAACSISPRQVQVSTGRLIKVGLLKRIGYDFGNIDRSQRGTKYKLLVTQTDLNREVDGIGIKSSIREIISHQASIEASLKRLALIRDTFPFYETSLALHRPTLRDIKRDVRRLKPEQRRKLADRLQRR